MNNVLRNELWSDRRSESFLVQSDTVVQTLSRAFDPDPFDGILGLGFSIGSFFQSLTDQGLPGP